MKQSTDLELIPGIQGTPVFKTQAEYDAWHADFCEKVRPEMERHRLARIESIKDSMTRVVY